MYGFSNTKAFKLWQANVTRGNLQTVFKIMSVKDYKASKDDEKKKSSSMFGIKLTPTTDEDSVSRFLNVEVMEDRMKWEFALNNVKN